MKKCYIQNLALNVTDNCNLECSHCLRGDRCNRNMSDEVIEATLSQIKGAGNIAINGGEPTLALDRIEKIINYIIDNNIYLDEFTTTINGTIYSEELLRLLGEIDKYIPNDETSAAFAISLDNYHLEELKRLNLLEEFKENVIKYNESKYFYGLRDIYAKLFREGRATELDNFLTVPLRPMKSYITYAGKNKQFDRENGLCNIGPIIAIGTNGNITECDASLEHQNTIYNYGNVLNESIEENTLRRGILLTKPKKMERIANKELKRYSKYNK